MEAQDFTMPKIDAILAAERKLAILEDTTLNALRDERALLASQLAALDQEIETLIAPVRASLEEAHEAQKWTLTKWVQSEGGHASYTRYVLRMDDRPTDMCWDSRAWLRIMKHGGDDRVNERWWWTLDIKPHTYKFSQVVVDPRQKNPSAPRPSPEEMIRAADEALIAAGYTLTNIAPESFKAL